MSTAMGVSSPADENSGSGDQPSDADAAAQAAGLFADARAMHAAALVRLADDDIRDAAEKAWCATLRATDGLIVGRTGQAPRKSTATTRTLRSLAGSDPEITALMRSYFTSQSTLHGDCFYLGMCEPLDHTEHLIRETIDYIAEAERLAEAVVGAPRSEP